VHIDEQNIYTYIYNMSALHTPKKHMKETPPFKIQIPLFIVLFSTIIYLVMIPSKIFCFPWTFCFFLIIFVYYILRILFPNYLDSARVPTIQLGFVLFFDLCALDLHGGR